MTVRSTAPLGAPTWADLATRDQAAALTFYSALFGWTAETPNPELGNYANLLRDGQRIVGTMPVMSPDTPVAWTVHFASEDAEKTTTLVTENGGVLHAPAIDVMDLGRLAVAADPGGAAFGIWQAGTHLGFPVLDEPGAPTWFELQSRDYDAVLDFYRTVLGWQTQVVSDAAPDVRYSAVVIDGQQVAGVMDGDGFLPEGVPSSWQVYFSTINIEASVAKAVELGATMPDPIDDTPYGRLAVLTDPTGAKFKLRQP